MTQTEIVLDNGKRLRITTSVEAIVEALTGINGLTCIDDDPRKVKLGLAGMVCDRCALSRPNETCFAVTAWHLLNRVKRAAALPE